MATLFKSQDQLNRIAKLTLFGQLLPERDDHLSPSSGSESWKCAFSDDDQLFAWSVGNRQVVLTTQIGPKQNALDKPIKVDCGHVVRSLIFASVPNLNESTAFWHRTASRKDFFLITGHVNGIIRVWDVETGKLLLQLSDHKDAVSDLCFIKKKGLLVSASFDGTAKIWDLIEDGNLHKTLKTDGKPIYACCVSNDAKHLATTGMSKVVNVWESQEFSIKFQLNGHHHNVVSCSFSPDGCLLATASWDTSIIIWDVLKGNKLRHLCQMNPPPRLIFAAGDNGNFIRSLAFSPDGYHIATVADDGFVRIWDILNDNEPEAVAPISEGLCCTYSNSGRILTVGTRTGAISVFNSHCCTKSLLFLCRLAVKKYFPTIEFSQYNKTNGALVNPAFVIPNRLVDFLNYEEWI